MLSLVWKRHIEGYPVSVTKQFASSDLQGAPTGLFQRLALAAQLLLIGLQKAPTAWDITLHQCRLMYTDVH